MKHSMILTGDINLMGVQDAEIPFARVAERLNAADIVFANLECCFYEPEQERSVEDEGFYASLAVAQALNLAGVDVVGNANNVNFGAPAIRSSLRCLDEIGVRHTGAGVNQEEAARPVILERGGVRYGFLQRSSVFHSRGHEATADYPGIATLKGHTAYRPKLEELRALTRPGMAPEVLTWADPAALERYRDDIAELRQAADVVVASHHWGLDGDVLQYQREIAHAAIDSGADIVFGHGPHVPCAVEVYRDIPVFYGAGSFSFETGHNARTHPDWIGMMVTIDLEDGAVQRAAFSFVRHNDQNETIFRSMAEEAATLEALRAQSAALGCKFQIDGDEAVVWQNSEQGEE